ncbi:MAG TPA: hypothetical protein VG940_13330 [Gemmatimonadales bacterium]|nr:hypothetical protein [Gemmatimonadales bacterium]
MLVLAGPLEGQARAATHPAPSTQHPAPNAILVVLDGVRWQEVFRGADCSFIEDTAKGRIADTAAFRRRFCRPTADSAREALMPWLWGTLARRGALFGDRDAGSDAHISNTMKFSYPGYNEILTGAFDPRIDKNDFGPNPNVTVLEWLHRRPGFRGRVRAWGTWDVFDDIFNEARAGFPVRSGWEVPFPGPRDAVERELDAIYATTTRHWAYMPPDAFLQRSVLQSLRVDRPRVLYVGFGEPDEWAHDERYDNYAISLNAADGYLRELWSWVERTPGYAGRTTLMVLCDHGRERTHRDWSDHGRGVDGAEEIWMGAIGPGVPALGVVRSGELIQAQVAATLARAVGEEWGSFNAAAAPAVDFVTFRR